MAVASLRYHTFKPSKFAQRCLCVAYRPAPHLELSAPRARAAAPGERRSLLAALAAGALFQNAASDRLLLLASTKTGDLRLALALAPKASRGDM